MLPVPHPGPRAALAACYEAQHGPLPDVVETCGQSLVGGFSTPTWPPNATFDPVFYARLYHALRVLEERQAVRATLYGSSLAGESRLAHTPPPVRAQFQSDEHRNLRDFIRCLTPPTPSTLCNTPPPFLSPSTVGSNATASPPPIDTPSLVENQPAPKTAKRRLDEDGCEIFSTAKRLRRDVSPALETRIHIPHSPPPMNTLPLGEAEQTQKTAKQRLNEDNYEPYTPITRRKKAGILI
ncbi:hypothetical protein P154DRAFT_564151 [Amniculicola lignicola CBS 123094]|uniref:Uncharacterized protein n=1 Tax=Amniculicola lignicola CBS 123094 TaxID=1392246 RepID=A0A6A5WJ84_9PLEO|nr:hypothetical protein P154DRAFT_564151 [Amniculicola lignicola CBS 123094]